ncbi:MAG: response regulator transcription factor [Motiliproteus sp.]
MLKIAVLESDRVLADDIMAWLGQAGHDFTCCSEPDELLACLAAQSFDMLLLDCGCHQQRSFDLIEQGLALQEGRIPLLFISQSDAESEIIHALKHGADDYMVKPISADELLNRIHVLVHRLGGCSQIDDQAESILYCGPFIIDRGQRLINRNDEVLVLTEKDFSLAEYLFSHPNQLLSRHRLLSEVWGVSQQVNTRTVDMHISRLRKTLQLEDSGYEIQTVHQHGYRLQSSRDE